jgi:hypothetical protein
MGRVVTWREGQAGFYVSGWCKRMMAALECQRDCAKPKWEPVNAKQRRGEAMK